MQNTEKLTYVKRASGKDMSRIVTAVLFPMAVFFLSIFSISIFKNFGKYLLTPLMGAMWTVGAGCAIWMPSMRRSIIKETLTTIASYNGTLLCLRKAIELTSGVSSQMLMATFGQPIAQAASNTLPGFLQNMLYISCLLVPLAFLGMQGKRVIQFRRNASAQKVYKQIRSSRQQDE